MVNVGDYIAVKYDNSWWIGIILEATPEDELLVKFTLPSGPWQTFRWPKHDDTSYVPKADLLSQISTPNISRSIGVYQITDEEFKCLSEIDLQLPGTVVLNFFLLTSRMQTSKNKI